MTVFPDSVANEGAEDIPSTQILHDRQTNLQKMAQPSQVLKAALQNLINYQVNSSFNNKSGLLYALLYNIPDRVIIGQYKFFICCLFNIIIFMQMVTYINM